MMRILHIYKDYYPVLGGIENHVRVLAEAGAARGHAITVLATSRDRRTQRAELNGVKLIKTSRWMNISSAPISPTMFLEARNLGHTADIIHLHFPYPPGEMARLFSGSRAKTIITVSSVSTTGFTWTWNMARNDLFPAVDAETNVVCLAIK